MKNLSTKTLFISLLSLAVIPSDVQADFFIPDSVKLIVGEWIGETLGRLTGMTAKAQTTEAIIRENPKSYINVG